MDINEGKALFLKEELEEYEKVMPMTDEERAVLHKWVADGNSVHENGSYGVWEGGTPIDFLDVYRWDKEEREKINAMSSEEHSQYLNEEYGIGKGSDPIILPENYWEEDQPWERP